MIDCYLLSVCRGSSLERDTNNFSLFHMIEEVQLPEAALGQVLPFEMHFYLAVTPESLNTRAEFRIVWRDEAGVERPGANAFLLELNSPRVRNRTAAIQVPPVAGQYRIYLEWRQPGTAVWARSIAWWPFAVSVQEQAVPSATPPAPGVLT